MKTSGQANHIQMALDIKSLQRELDELRKERTDARQRVDSFRFGGGTRPGAPSASGRVEHDLPSFRSGDRDGPRGRMDSGMNRSGSGRLDGPSPRGGLDKDSVSWGRFGGQGQQGQGRSSVFNRLAGGGGSGASGPSRSGAFTPRETGLREGLVPSPSEQVNLAPAAPRRRVASAAVVVHSSNGNDEKALDQEPASEIPDSEQLQRVGSKRPTPCSTGEGGAANKEDTGMRKRNRRMFGALLGTLQKFRDEDQQFEATDTAQRRREIQRQASEKAKEESERLRKAASEQRHQQRQSEIRKLQLVNLAADQKVLEIIYAKKIIRKEALGKFLSTKASPLIFWMPAQHNSSTESLAEQQRQELELWKTEILEELEQEKDGLRQRMEARHEEAMLRREAAQRQQGTTAGESGAAAAAAEDEDAAEREELEAGEYDAEDDQKGTTEGMHNNDKGRAEPQVAVDAAMSEDSDPQEDGMGDTRQLVDADTVEDLLAD